jgi:hypothetical protein
VFSWTMRGLTTPHAAQDDFPAILTAPSPAIAATAERCFDLVRSVDSHGLALAVALRPCATYFIPRVSDFESVTLHFIAV